MRRTTMLIAVVCLSVGSVFGTDSSVPFIHADDVRTQGITGLGVTVAVIDTGIFSSHPGFVAGIALGGDSIIGGTYIGDGGEDIWPQYSGWHGTNVSLIITDETGVAHDAKILPIRVFEVWGGDYGADPDDIIEAINYTRNLRAADPSIQVINLSLGYFGDNGFPLFV